MSTETIHKALTIPGIDLPSIVPDVGDVVSIIDGARSIADSVVSAVQGFEITKGSAAAQGFLASEFGTEISNFAYSGSEDAVFRVSNFAIPGTGISWDGGILLSSGRMPGIVNTFSAFSKAHGQPGDADLTDVAQAAFSGAGQTEDAAVISFDFTVTDPGIKGIRFDIVFGSDEFSEYSDSSFVDVAAVWLDDDRDGRFELSENKALFGGNASTPLSVISQNAGNFIDNEDKSLPIEWDGFGALSVRPAVNTGTNSIKIGIADTGDQILDSGLFLTNFQFLREGATGTEIFRVVAGAAGSNALTASALREELQLAEGEGSVSGRLADLDGDIVSGFSGNSKIILDTAGAAITQVDTLPGATVLNIDTNSDGTADGTIKLEGNYQGAVFSTAASGGGGTEISADLSNVDPNALPTPTTPSAPSLPSLAEKQALGVGVNNGMFQDLTGDGSKRFQATLDPALSEAAFQNVLGVYEITQAGALTDARLLIPNAKSAQATPLTIDGVEAGHKLGFFLVADGAAWAEGLAESDALEFRNTQGNAATLDDGASLQLAVNGAAATDLTIYHSHRSSMNADGFSHVVSGTTAEGGPMVIGFEDQDGGGDLDFQDVVFAVADLI